MGHRRSRKTICIWLLSFGVEIQKDTPFDEAQHSKSLDRSARSVFRNLIDRFEG